MANREGDIGVYFALMLLLFIFSSVAVHYAKTESKKQDVPAYSKSVNSNQ